MPDATTLALVDEVDGLIDYVRTWEPERLTRGGWRGLADALENWRAAHPVNLDDDKVGPGRATDPATSSRAATVASIRAGAAKHLIGEVFYDAPAYGFTAEEAVEKAGLGHQRSPWHRVSDLRHMGVLRPLGSTRTASSGAEAEVLVMTAEGRRQWAARFHGDEA